MYVLIFSGVFLERQYRAFTGLVYGQKTHDFLTDLVERGYLPLTVPFQKFSAFHQFIAFVIDEVLSEDARTLDLDLRQDRHEDQKKYKRSAMESDPTRLPVDIAMERFGILDRTLHLFDVAAGTWTDLHADHVDTPTWSRDSKSIFYLTEGASRPSSHGRHRRRTRGRTAPAAPRCARPGHLVAAQLRFSVESEIPSASACAPAMTVVAFQDRDNVVALEQAERLRVAGWCRCVAYG